MKVSSLSTRQHQQTGRFDLTHISASLQLLTQDPFYRVSYLDLTLVQQLLVVGHVYLIAATALCGSGLTLSAKSDSRNDAVNNVHCNSHCPGR